MEIFEIATLTVSATVNNLDILSPYKVDLVTM